MDLLNSPLWRDYLLQGKLPEVEVGTKTIVETVAYLSAGILISLVVFIILWRATETK